MFENFYRDYLSKTSLSIKLLHIMVLYTGLECVQVTFTLFIKIERHMVILILANIEHIYIYGDLILYRGDFNSYFCVILFITMYIANTL